ncbi:type I secretion system permease/ATPase [Sphingomonas sp. PL-96]|uniref:type I secretion system permease/ATPase n=1 Tax=Sphingomonas sp. PL-96 TaxID=2887201 RepID=UPI001E3E9A37|nr:type I secretion system permease/ATPase [Sphingomonas sp. PL-96]MCC2975220.1 type I secretion system permease/ATPase [Sphingomonas sp. PL-96]
MRGPRARSQKRTRRNPALADALAACRAHLIHAALFSALLNLLYLAPSLYMLQVYDRVVPTRGVTTLAMLTLIFLAAVATLGMLDLLRTRLLIRASARLDRLLGRPLIATLLQAPNALKQGGVLLREFDTLRQTITGLGVIALFDAPWSPIYMGVCFLLHPALGLMAVACSAVLLLLTFLNERGTKALVQDASAAQQHGYQMVEASLAAAGVVRALGMQDGLVRLHLRDRQVAQALQMRAAFMGARYLTLARTVRIAMQSLALGLGALLAIEQQISGGTIFAASLLISRALAPIEGITGAWRNMIQARAAYHGLQAVFEASGPAGGQTRLPEVLGEIAVEQLSVADAEGERLVLHGISLRVRAGEMVGVVGPSGAGKSTLVRALVGAQPAAAGMIRIDGAALGDWPEAQLAAAIGYVPQEPTLFQGTIKQNIARFRHAQGNEAAALDAEVIRAAQQCGAHAFILRLPQAYDTRLGWNGAGLSVGQAQRIALARALFGRPRILVLDEPNASLDAEGEAQLTAALAEQKRAGVTIVVVAHRTGILAASDKLVVLRDGRLDLFDTREAVVRQLSGNRAIAGEPAAAGGAA